jgi:beta-glucosidase
MYISLPNSGIYRPKKELRGFAKTYLEVGEAKRVRIDFDEYTFRYFDTEADSWQIETGDYDVIIAASAISEMLRGTIHKEGVSASDNAPECYRGATINNVSDEDYKALLGRDIPNGAWSGEITKNDAICQLYYAKSGLARFVYKVLTKLKSNSEAKGKPDLNILFIYNMPFRAIAKMSGGMVSEKMVDDIVSIVNGDFFGGFGRLVKDFFKNLSLSNSYNKLISEKENQG